MLSLAGPYFVHIRVFCVLASPVRALVLGSQFLGDDNDLLDVITVSSGHGHGHSPAYGMGRSDSRMKLRLQAHWVGVLSWSRPWVRPWCGTMQGESREGQGESLAPSLTTPEEMSGAGSEKNTCFLVQLKLCLELPLVRKEMSTHIGHSPSPGSKIQTVT